MNSMYIITQTYPEETDPLYRKTYWTGRVWTHKQEKAKKYKTLAGVRNAYNYLTMFIGSSAISIEDC